MLQEVLALIWIKVFGRTCSIQEDNIQVCMISGLAVMWVRTVLF